jgi:hypothetical protein
VFDAGGFEDREDFEGGHFRGASGASGGGVVEGGGEAVGGCLVEDAAVFTPEAEDIAAVVEAGGKEEGAGFHREAGEHGGIAEGVGEGAAEAGEIGGEVELECGAISEGEGDARAFEGVRRGEAEFFKVGRGHSRGAMRGMGKEVLRIKF